jgi:hypothetical protein
MLRDHTELVVALAHRISVEVDLTATILSSITEYPWKIRKPAEVEVVVTVEMEVEVEVEMEAVVRSLLGVRNLPMNGPLRTLCAQCPRSLGKVLEMHLNSEILPPWRSLGPESGTLTPSMERIPKSSAPSSSRASSISRIAPRHSSGITRRSII